MEGQLFENKLDSVIGMLFNHMKHDQKLVLEDTRDGSVSIEYREIVYVESRQHYCIFYIRPRSSDKTAYKIRKNISELEHELEQFDFVRVHKKYIVNLAYVISIDKTNRIINLKNNFAVNLGPVYKKKVEDEFYSYLRKY